MSTTDTLLNHRVNFRLINRFGDGLDMGMAIFGQPEGSDEVFDEDGVTFPNIETGLRHHAMHLMQVVYLPGHAMPRPTRHETWQDTEATAFPIIENKF